MMVKSTFCILEAFPYVLVGVWCSGLPSGLSLSLLLCLFFSFFSRGLLAGTGALHMLSRRLTIPSPSLPLTP